MGFIFSCRFLFRHPDLPCISTEFIQSSTAVSSTLTCYRFPQISTDFHRVPQISRFPPISLRPTAFHRFPQSSTEFRRPLQISTEFNRVPESSTDFHRALQTSTDFHRAPQSSTDFYRFPQSSTVLESSTYFHRFPQQFCFLSSSVPTSSRSSGVTSSISWVSVPRRFLSQQRFPKVEK